MVLFFSQFCDTVILYHTNVTDDTLLTHPRGINQNGLHTFIHHQGYR